MADKKIKETMQSIGVNAAIKYLDRNPEENIPKLLDWMVRFDAMQKQKRDKDPFVITRESLSDKNGNWYRLATSLWSDIDTKVRMTLFKNFVVNATIVGYRQQNEAKDKFGCNIPWAILMDPTSACNLNCIGCWAAEYEHNQNLSLETWDSIIRQGKAMGTYIYLYSGGEPMVRKADILKMCEAHQDCVFLAFTNGTLIDEAFADGMLKVRNFIPAISVEGFEKETDARRGEGTYRKAMQAMELLRRKKLPFGASCCYTSQNTDIIGSEAYIDDLISKGCKFAWFFTYIPVGVDAVPDLLATAQQREFMYHQLRAFRKTKPLFTMDFWNDGEFVGGCIAGGRAYLHINAAGDIEPCAFIHYSDSNIHEKTILEACQSPLFSMYQARQPFSANMLQPCPLLDNPESLADIIDLTLAKSTDMMHPEDVHELTRKCINAAENWAPAADRLWQCSRNCVANEVD